MLRGINEYLTPDLLYALAKMGHGDLVAIVDRNYPAHSSASEPASVVELPGTSATEIVEAVASVLPRDDYSDWHIVAMGPSSESSGPATEEVRRVLAKEWGPDLTLVNSDRFTFYEECTGASVVVRTGDDRPYACFLLTKGTL